MLKIYFFKIRFVQIIAHYKLLSRTCKCDFYVVHAESGAKLYFVL